ncbi:MAG: tyrosine-type recombinase/integrase [Pseudomonadota bacterium]
MNDKKLAKKEHAIGRRKRSSQQSEPNPNHPKKGSIIKVEPIRDLRAIKRIKKLREDSSLFWQRDFCLFTLGVNTAYRANELLSISVGQVDYLKPGDRIELLQSKTKKRRGAILNKTVAAALDQWLTVHPYPDRSSPLFISSRGFEALTVPTVSRMVKLWCEEAGLRGNYGSHTLRKTWGYHQLRKNNVPIPLLMEAYGHSTQRQTLEYLCIESNEIEELYALEL